MLFNSEVWHGIEDNDLKVLESIDENLLRYLVKAHSKTPLEFLYLETGAIPIRFLISSRRLIYLRTILMKDDSELVKRIFKAQLENPSPGDYIELLKNNFQKIEESYDEQEVVNKCSQTYKKSIKMKIRKAALKYLNDLKNTHTKIKNINYETLKCQDYLKSSMFSNTDVNTLFSLRSRMIECKVNFKSKHQNNNLKCKFCKTDEDDSQEHLLECIELARRHKGKSMTKEKVEYQDIFKDVIKQKQITQIYTELLEIRKKLEEDDQHRELDPSTVQTVLRNSFDLHNSIDNYSFGK